MMKIVTVLVAISAALANPTPRVIDPQANWRVVGGSTAAPGQFRFIISLRTASNSHTCGGSLIRSSWVITAAHCVTAAAAMSYTVVAGINQLSSNSGVTSGISKIIIHPGYNPSSLVNDIALLQLSTPIQASSLISFIELEDSHVDDVRNATLIGWGRTSYPGTIPDNLQFLESRTVTHNMCRTYWINQNVQDSHVCTLTQAGEGACHGDSGGPLVDADNGKLIGVVSWGSPCARGAPDVYTRVSSFTGWVNDNVGN